MTTKRRGDRDIIPCPWMSDGSGNAEVAIPDSSEFSLQSVQTIPGQDGDLLTDVPTDNYSVIMEDKWGFDTLRGRFENNRSNALADEPLIADCKIPLTGRLTIYVSGAGAANQGLVEVVLQRNREE